ncbi:MAG: NYN domain-containing protein [Gammaproteobacteria bacterium]|nr:NYN domain-containing protein [Gammaproteobacteria bacterium]
MTRRVLVDGNNVMGSRPDGWWRNRAEAAQRLVADIVPVARSLGGTWTVVFDGAQPPLMRLPERVSVVHTGHGRRDGADDHIVALVGALPDPALALVYTSDAGLRARVHALGARVAGARALLDEIAAVREATGSSASDELVVVPRGPSQNPS